MNVLDGVLKGVATSLLGFIVMGLAVYGWIWGDWFTSDVQALIFGGIGFALLFVREKLAENVIDWLKGRLGGGTKPPAP